ncbi:hypothetical protein D6C91_08145 [Aureobasidium pullulans]|uniref:Uncharacterized protein n=1 Tax=Aureobasidium pullulans TaxID=5580 RepID=A0A4S9SQ54_AURPU|nr:hypothetical protein D6C91_08145 [Aureobasidium pullulans]
MQIPTFFLRTTIRLLLFQALVAWLSMRSHNLPLPSAIRWTLTTTLGSYVTTAKDILDNRFGFILPWEATFILPAALDEYITKSMPDLAILLGTSPCDERVTPNDPDTKLCAPMLAHHCFGHAEMFPHKPKARLRIMEACWQNYHTDVITARKHYDRCHKNEPPSIMQLNIGRRSWGSAAVVVSSCVLRYGAQDTMAEFEREKKENADPEKADSSESEETSEMVLC